jgi:hypothetical protein
MDLGDLARLVVLPQMGRARQSLEVTARRMGIAASTLYGALDPAVSKAPLTLEKAVGLTRATGDYLLMHAQAAQLGGLFIEPPAEGVSTVESLAHALARMSAEHGDVLQAFAAATDPDGDGGVDCSPEELARFDREVAEWIAALGGLRAALAKGGVKGEEGSLKF